MPKRQDPTAQIIRGAVHHRATHDPIETKQELKELVADAPHRVEFYATAQFPPQKGMTLVLTDLKIGQKLVIVGPDPATKRDWSANVERKSSGQLRVT